tara:strand:+ start:2100 stop:2615 length:516 start_codon:yes stop_codon:yes gene_type:complete
MSESSENKWFVAQLKPNGLRLATTHLARQGFGLFCPKLSVAETATRRTGSRLKPMFPGYLFVHFDSGTPNWTAINSTRGVARLIVQDIRLPQALPAGFIPGLMARCDAAGALKPTEDLKKGDRVRIVSGPFADVVTRIENMSDSERLGVLIDLLGGAVRMTLRRHQIEKLD